MKLFQRKGKQLANEEIFHRATELAKAETMGRGSEIKPVAVTFELSSEERKALPKGITPLARLQLERGVFLVGAAPVGVDIPYGDTSTDMADAKTHLLIFEGDGKPFPDPGQCVFVTTNQPHKIIKMCWEDLVKAVLPGVVSTIDSFLDQREGAKS